MYAALPRGLSYRPRTTTLPLMEGWIVGLIVAQVPLISR
jgi:hypothetical protein